MIGIWIKPNEEYDDVVDVLMLCYWKLLMHYSFLSKIDFNVDDISPLITHVMPKEYILRCVTREPPRAQTKLVFMNFTCPHRNMQITSSNIHSFHNKNSNSIALHVLIIKIGLFKHNR